MNLRPSGYEPDELPDCSTPQQGLDSTSFAIRDTTRFARDTRLSAPDGWSPGAGAPLLRRIPCGFLDAQHLTGMRSNRLRGGAEPAFAGCRTIVPASPHPRRWYAERESRTDRLQNHAASDWAEVNGAPSDNDRVVPGWFGWWGPDIPLIFNPQTTGAPGAADVNMEETPLLTTHPSGIVAESFPAAFS